MNRLLDLWQKVVFNVNVSQHFQNYLGEKLSKQELQFNNTIKKLRAKEKQNEQLMTAQRCLCEVFNCENKC